MSFIKKMYVKLTDETKQYVPIAITVVEGVKKVLDSEVDDVILSIIGYAIPNLPIAQINVIKAKLEKALPKIILELNLINTVANTVGINEQLQLIIAELRLSSDDIKAEKYHTLASKILIVLSDGKITWGEAVMFTEWYYQNYVKA